MSKIVRTKLVCDKVVCESCCVTKWRRRRGGGGGEGGGGSGYRIKNKNPTQSCGEQKNTLARDPEQCCKEHDEEMP